MTLIIFTMLSLLGCGFMLHVLVHWMRDTGSKPAAKDTGGPERHTKQIHVVSSKKTIGHGENLRTCPDDSLNHAEQRQRQSEPNLHRSERNAYQRIAKSLIHRKRA